MFNVDGALELSPYRIPLSVPIYFGGFAVFEVIDFRMLEDLHDYWDVDIYGNKEIFIRNLISENALKRVSIESV